ncbi:MAG: hypothetical protein QXW18_07115 [Candidatus Bathyarchaeia archaeon]
MAVLVVVSCGFKKIWDLQPDAGPKPARDAYVSAFFKTNREYAEKFADRWVILSAKYGFIDPDSIIPENYNVTFKKPQTKPVSLEKLKEQIKEKNLSRFDKVVVLGGRDYVEIVRRAFGNFRVKVIAPTSGLRLGEAMAKVRRAIENNDPFDC